MKRRSCGPGTRRPPTWTVTTSCWTRAGRSIMSARDTIIIRKGGDKTQCTFNVSIYDKTSWEILFHPAISNAHNQNTILYPLCNSNFWVKFKLTLFFESFTYGKFQFIFVLNFNNKISLEKEPFFLWFPRFLSI